jgi:hypothetical protein
LSIGFSLVSDLDRRDRESGWGLTIAGAAEQWLSWVPVALVLMAEGQFH